MFLKELQLSFTTQHSYATYGIGYQAQGMLSAAYYILHFIMIFFDVYKDHLSF